MSHLQSQWLAPALLCAGLSCNLYAVDGVVLIDQNRALAGNVTPGDAPGFPVTISQTGSYRLSGNLTVPDANTTAILVAADNVTIDLNGFSIIGPTVCSGFPFVTSCSPTGTGRGVDQGISGPSSTTVVNGSIRGMGRDGIQLQGQGSYVEKVHADSNSGEGIFVSNGVVSGNTASNNRVDGIFIVNGTASGNSAVGNGRIGILTNCPSTVVNNTAYFNATNLFINGANCAAANNAVQ